MTLVTGQENLAAVLEFLVLPHELTTSSLLLFLKVCHNAAQLIWESHRTEFAQLFDVIFIHTFMLLC